MLENFVFGIMSARKGITNFLEKNPVYLNIEIKSPIVIIGLPRTGSTFLQALLAQDPDARHLRFWEGNIPSPPPLKETYHIDPRIQLVEKGLNSPKIIDANYMDGLRQHHFVSGDGFEEDLLLLHHCMILFSHYYLTGEGAFKDWFYHKDKVFAYHYLKRFLQHLSSKYPPKTHWLLKAPVNTLYIDSLLTEFPDACVVVTHRHPKYVIPSWSQFQAQMLNIYLEIDHDCSRQYIRETLFMTSEMGRRLVAHRKKGSDPRQFLDISFEELTSNPIGTAKKIYEHFGKPFTEEFHQKMVDFLKEPPKEGKTKAPKLTLRDIQLDEEEVEKEFAEYLQMFEIKS